MMTTSETAPKPKTEHCPLCDSLLLESLNECSRCDWVKRYSNRSAPAGTVDIAACLLSIIPGAGHYYKGHKGMALLYCAGALLAAFWCGLAATATMGLGLLMLPLYWAWMAAHAYWIEDLEGAFVLETVELRDVPVNPREDLQTPDSTRKIFAGKN